MAVTTPQYNPGVPTYSYDDELAMAEEQLARADALRKRARGPVSKGQMVSGWYVAPHWTEQLSPIMDEVLAGYHEAKGREAKQRGNRAIEEQAQAWINSRPQPTTQDVVAEVPGPQPQELEGQTLMGTRQQIVQPTQQQNLQWAQQGMKNPLTKALAAQYGSDVLIKEPEREEARAFRGAEAEKQRELQRERFMENNKMMTMYYTGILNNQQNSTEQRREAAAALAAIKQSQVSLESRSLDIKQQLADQQLQIAKIMSGDRRYAIDEKIKANRAKMNPKLTKELDEADSINSGIDVALGKLEKVDDSPAGAYARGVVQQIPFGGERLAAGMRSEEDKEARQTAANVAGGIQHDRYGTALSKYEKGNAAQYLPTEYDDAPRIAQKLKGLKELMALNHKRLRLMEEGGVSLEEAQRAFPSDLNKPPAVNSGTSSTAAPAGLPPGVTVRRKN